MDFTILEQVPSAEEYCELRKICGLAPKTIKAANMGLPRSLYAISIRSDGKLVGMGRIVGDLGCHVQITDIAVRPEFQGQGLGNLINKHILDFVKKECPECCFVNLFADVDYLYQKFGFVPLLKSKGMYLDWSKVIQP